MQKRIRIVFEELSVDFFLAPDLKSVSQLFLQREVRVLKAIVFFLYMDIFSKG